MNRDIYQEVTDSIIEQLEAGTAPWIRPWDESKGMPRNGNSGRNYSGVNVLLLWSKAIKEGYTSQEWYTFKGAKRAGGHVKKGESGTLVTFWKILRKEEENDSGEKVEKTIPLLRYYYVFNREQVDGLPPPEKTEPQTEPQLIVDKAGATIKHGGPQAYYRPSTDEVTLPIPESFVDMGAYYSTAFHELTHWTAPRLGRDLDCTFGSEQYGREELVAELGSAFLCAASGVDGTLRHPEYLASWLKLLKEDNRAIFRASTEAKNASEWILDRVADATEEAA